MLTKWANVNWIILEGNEQPSYLLSLWSSEVNYEPQISMNRAEKHFKKVTIVVIKAVLDSRFQLLIFV